MTIRTKEAEVPTEFPPARLFLDDIEEIVRILVQATQSQDDTGGVSTPKVTFTVKDRICDEAEELPKIAKKTTNLWILVEAPNLGPANSVSVGENGSRLTCYALKEAEQLKLFQKLAPIFKRRNLRFRTFVWSHYWASFGLLFGMTLATLISPVIFVLKRGISPHLMRTFVGDAIVMVAAIITLWATLFYHTIFIMRASSEPSALRQGLRDKLPAMLIGIAIGSVLTFFLTLLGYYLKHKYWP